MSTLELHPARHRPATSAVSIVFPAMAVPPYQAFFEPAFFEPAFFEPAI
jgi:hypothetical protein